MLTIDVAMDDTRTPDATWNTATTCADMQLAFFGIGGPTVVATAAWACALAQPSCHHPAATAALLPAAGRTARLLLNRWELGVHHPFKMLLDAEFNVERAGAIGFGTTQLHHIAFAS